jgi:hypothetical protein
MTSLNKSLLNDMESFDLLYINYNYYRSTLSRAFQKIYTGNGTWSHVGIIIKNDIIPTIENKIYIWHSSVRSEGVQLYELEKYCKLQDLNITEIGWCKLKNNPLHRKMNDTDEGYNQRIKKIKKQINYFYIHTKNSTFNHFMPKLVFPFLQNLSSKQLKPYMRLNIKKSYFCSEFVTTIYKIINAVDKNIEPDSTLPETLINYKNENGKIFNDPITITLVKNKN